MDELLFSVWLAGGLMFSLAWVFAGDIPANARYPFFKIWFWPLYPVYALLSLEKTDTVKPDEIVPGVENPTMILARMVAASILQYPDGAKWEVEPISLYDPYLAGYKPRFDHCTWVHPVNGTNVFFKRSWGDGFLRSFDLSFKKQVSDDQAIIERPYLRGPEQVVIVKAWKEALRIKEERQKIAQESERQMKAVGVIESYFKSQF